MAIQKGLFGQDIDAKLLKKQQDFQSIRDWQDYAYWIFSDFFCCPDCIVSENSDDCKVFIETDRCSAVLSKAIVIARDKNEAYSVAIGEETDLSRIGIDPVIQADFEYTEWTWIPEDANRLVDFNLENYLRLWEGENES